MAEAFKRVNVFDDLIASIAKMILASVSVRQVGVCC